MFYLHSWSGARILSWKQCWCGSESSWNISLFGKCMKIWILPHGKKWWMIGVFSKCFMVKSMWVPFALNRRKKSSFETICIHLKPTRWFLFPTQPYKFVWWEDRLILKLAKQYWERWHTAGEGDTQSGKGTHSKGRGHTAGEGDT